MKTLPVHGTFSPSNSHSTDCPGEGLASQFALHRESRAPGPVNEKTAMSSDKLDTVVLVHKEMKSIHTRRNSGGRVRTSRYHSVVTTDPRLDGYRWGCGCAPAGQTIPAWMNSNMRRTTIGLVANESGLGASSVGSVIDRLHRISACA